MQTNKQRCLTDKFHGMWKEICALLFVSLEPVTTLVLADQGKAPSSEHCLCWLSTASKQTKLSTKKTFLTFPTCQHNVHVDLVVSLLYLYFLKAPQTCLLENFSLESVMLVGAFVPTCRLRACLAYSHL